MRSFLAYSRRFGTSTVLFVAVATVAALAATANGFPVKHLDLNDGGIWVTSNSAGAAGRFNKPIAQLDGLVSTASAAPDLDVAQNGPLVAVWDKNASRLYAVDDFKPAFAGSVTVSAAQVALGGSTLAVLSTSHALRLVTLDAGGGSLAAAGGTAPARASHLPANAAIAVASDNAVYVAGGGRLLRYPAGDAGRPVTSAIPLPGSDPMQVTAVGAVPVLGDATSRTLYLPDSGRTVRLPAGGAAAVMTLQQPSEPSAFVVAETAKALYAIDLSTGQVSTLSTGHQGTAAAPVQVAGCVHAVWNVGAVGTYVRSCGGLPPAASSEQTFRLSSASPSLVFRVNRGQVVLNDTTDGGVFLVDSVVTNARPQWQQRQRQKNHKQHHTVSADESRTPLVAKPDLQGVRPGRATVVHVLDNDSGPSGSLLAVTALSPPDQRGVSVSIAPDAQAVLASVPAGVTSDVHFRYTIDDGHDHTAQAEVTLVPRNANQNSPPELRRGYQPPALTVASGATIAISVIGDWRDFDGDPVYVDSSKVSASSGSVSVNNDGTLAYTAPQAKSPVAVTVRYAVSDGIAARPAPARLTVHVLAASSTDLVPPSAQPDVAQAVVGSPVVLHPLANDLPGADPTNPQAELTLAGPVAAVPGAGVTTDAGTGTVTFTAQRPGSFLLGYRAAFGAARTSASEIRIEAAPASGKPKPPVAVPDLAVIHGQQPTVVDVIANDYDPQGWVLGVLSASSPDPAVRVAVIAQHWLRISSDDPVPGATSTVTYIVSDGHASAAGTVSVTAVPAPASADLLATRDDSVVIRAGSSAAVPVLANDSSSAGLPLSLAEVTPTAAPAIAGLRAGDQGADVRVTAPASVRAETETTVSYVVTDASGAAATGHLQVTIEPLPSAAHPDQPPAPGNIDTRESAGDVLVIHVPTDGIDPDGDSAAVTAVTSPPSLGRIVSVGPTTIGYQSYPSSAGTDTFTYQVTDPYGETGTAQVHVGILPPGAPQQPIAVDDVLSAPPGASLHVDVLANDFVAAGDKAIVIPLARTNRHLPAGIRLIGSYVYLRVPARPSDPPLDITYGVTDGSSAPSLAQVIVRAVAGAKLPPIANDDVAAEPPGGAARVTVNVLRNDDDPTGSRSDLKITAVPARVSIRGASLTIPLTADPREIPYQVTAPDGLTATAVVHVPGSSTSAITVKPGARISLRPKGTVSVPLSSVLSDSGGHQLKITTTDKLAASPPGDITVDAHQSAAIVVRAPGSYTGPGAVTVQVYDGTSLQDPRGHTVTLTIPVQVGPDVPVLRCPKPPLQLVEGGSAQTYDIAQLCHVWVDTTFRAPAPRYAVSWAQAVSGVSASVTGGSDLRLSAASAARPGHSGLLRIVPAGARTGGEIGVTVIPAPLPAGRPVTVTGIQAGHAATVDLAQYVTSPLAQPHLQVLSVTRPGNATVTSAGSVVTITPAATAHGVISLTASVTDVPGRPDRRISVVITVDVVGRPGRPGQPSATSSSHTIVVSFGAAAASGAPIDHYSVLANGAAHLCPASPCTITGLDNNTTYDIDVTAHNSVGDGPPSGQVKATPNQVPDQVLGLKTSPGNTSIGLSWQPAHVDGSPVKSYVVEISPAPPGGPAIRSLGGTVTATTYSGLVNGTTYALRVEAINSLGAGPWSSSVSDVPFGKPLAMPAPSAAGASVPDPQTTRAITVSWQAGAGNGRPVSGYTVREYRSSSSAGPWTLASTSGPALPAGNQESFTVTNDGTWYEYTVTATNVAGESPASPRSAPVQGAAPPDAPGDLSAKDHDAGSDAGYNGAIHVDFTVPAPNAATLTSVDYGLNGQSVSGTWTSPGRVGASVDESITGLVNGTNYVVYVRGCNDAGLCGPWAGPSGQVTPYGVPAAPSVAAQANGTSITYTWNGGGGNGRPVDHYHVCFDGGSCEDTGAGSTTTTYGYSQTHTITAYVVDSAGQQSTPASAPATTGPPPAPTVSVGKGGPRTVAGCTTSPPCYYVDVTVANAAAGATMNYSCSDPGSGGQFWPTSGTTDKDSSNAVVHADGNGNASFQSQCVYGYWGESGHHLLVVVNGTSSP